jgi:hypothetical protein
VRAKDVVDQINRSSDRHRFSMFRSMDYARWSPLQDY